LPHFFLRAALLAVVNEVKPTGQGFAALLKVQAERNLVPAAVTACAAVKVLPWA